MASRFLACAAAIIAQLFAEPEFAGLDVELGNVELELLEFATVEPETLGVETVELEIPDETGVAYEYVDSNESATDSELKDRILS